MEHKNVPAYLKEVDDDLGLVECIFAVFGNIDEGMDILHTGSFKKTLSERGGKVRILDQHNTDSINRVLGKPVDIREIGSKDLPIQLKAEYPNATGGVWAKIQFFLNTPEGKGAFIRLKEGGIDEWSFGYDAVDVDHTSITIDGEKRRVRNLRTVKLFEVSPVLWAMNPATNTLGAKDDTPDKQEKAPQKMVTSYQNLDLAPRDRSWDSDAAKGRIREWAGGVDDMDWKAYQKAFFWHDSEGSDKFQSYKLPYADIVDDKLVAVFRGISAAAGSLQGARGQTPDIPDGDVDGIKNNINRYYEKMQTEFDDDTLIAPWNKAAELPEEKVEPLKGSNAAVSDSDGNDVPEKQSSFNFAMNAPEGFDFEELSKTLASALGAAGLTIAKDQKGSNLSKLLNDQIDGLVTDDRTRGNIIAEIGQSFGSTSAVVNQILDGDINCLTEHRAEKFSEILGITLARINTALKADGCTEENAADDPAEAKEAKMGGSRLGDVLQGNIHYAFTCLVDKWYIQGYMDRDERLLLSSLIGDALGVLDLGMPEDLASRDVSHGPIYADSSYGYYGLDPDIEAKAGRILSAANAQKIQAALAQLHEVLMAAGMLEEPDKADEESGVYRQDEIAKSIVLPEIEEADLLNLIEVEQSKAKRMTLF